MAWIVESDGNDELVSSTLGNLTASKIRVVSNNVTWASTGYLWSQAVETVSSREFGLWASSSGINLHAGGVRTLLTANNSIVDEDVDLTVDYNANTAEFIVGGVSVFSGAVGAGTSRVDGTLFRFFAREGGYLAPNGTRVGNTQIYIDDVLVRDYDFDNSSHAAGAVTVNEDVSSETATGTGTWVELAGSGITAEISESGPSFTENINSSLLSNITASISEVGPSFSESINVNLSSLPIQANISESGPSFLESISCDLGVNISLDITEVGPGFTESISASTTKTVTAILNESGPPFSESVIASIPITIAVNAKNTIRVKRKDNSVKIKRKTNIVRVG